MTVLQPLGDRILIKQHKAQTVSPGGIYIPEVAQEKPQEGVVLAVGPGLVDDNGNRVPLDVSVGDTVVYSNYGGTEVSHDGVDYLILTLSKGEVLAVLEG